MSRTHRTPAYELRHGKHPKKPTRDGHYTRSSLFCENHGGCPWCLGNRTHKHKRQQPLIEEADGSNSPK